jgi:hypothetical protein
MVFKTATFIYFFEFKKLPNSKYQPDKSPFYLLPIRSTIEIPLFLLVLAVLLPRRNFILITNTTRAAAPRPLLNITVTKTWSIGASDIGFLAVFGVWTLGTIFVSETAAHFLVLAAGDGGPGCHF